MNKLLYILFLLPVLAFGQTKMVATQRAISPNSESVEIPPVVTPPPSSSTDGVFDGALGWGADWEFPTYTVKKVTNLNNSGAGSLREAVSSQNSLVVFEVAGNIPLTSTLNISKNVYIAGQTAFRYGGEGINIHKGGSEWGEVLVITNGNLIMRYLTISGYPNAPNCCSDTIRITGSNTVIDHCSLRYGNDENVGISHADNVTVQYSIISYALSEKDVIASADGSSRGMIINKSNNVTIVGNIFGENTTRNPKMSGDEKPGKMEVVNNILFNHTSQGLSYSTSAEGNINVINNYVRRGRSPQPTRSRFNYDTRYLPASAKVYASGNLDDEIRPTLASGSELSIWSDSPNNRLSEPLAASRLANTPFNYPLTDGYTLLDADQLATVLLPTIGNSIVRDAIDSTLVTEYNQDDGIVTYPAPFEATDWFATPIPARGGMSGVESDTDGDGIPNSEEATWVDDTFGYVNDLVN